jgi:hypothetical protein
LIAFAVVCSEAALKCVNDRGAYAPEHRNQAPLHSYGNYDPDSQQWQPGLLANLQEARAIKQLLIKRSNGHVL